MSAPALRIGDLERRITIQQRAVVQDSFGQRLQSWVDFISCWASIEVTSAVEVDSAQAIRAEVVYKIVILYRASITTAMRVLYQGKVLDIVAATDEGLRHERLTLVCKEGMGLG